MIEATLFSRPDCHLCEQAKEDLEALRGQIPFRLTVIDVDSTHELREAYGFEVPVVEIGPYRLKAPFTRQELEMTLRAAADRVAHIETIEAVGIEQGKISLLWTKADSFTYWFSRHYLALFNLFVLLYVGLPVLAPVLMKSGADSPARVIYRAYGMVCHQLAYRSFFLFGEQPAYPRAAAGVASLTPFYQATGLSEAGTGEALLAARQFLGNAALGYKMALCERDIAIYGAILLFGLLYAVTGRRLPPLPWFLWILIGIVPIGLDGFSQLISQPPISLIPLRESTPYLRTLTGALFGFATAWFGYPLVEQTMEESRQIMADKLVRIRRWSEGKGAQAAD
jgi:uncharacterized membrane protein/glutaredoxin